FSFSATCLPRTARSAPTSASPCHSHYGFHIVITLLTCNTEAWLQTEAGPRQPRLRRGPATATPGYAMADDSKLPNIGGNGFIWIRLGAAGTFFVTHRVSLEGTRPATTERSIQERVGEQHVDARLWQDPFAAVANELAKSPELKPENCDRGSSRYKEMETYC